MCSPGEESVGIIKLVKKYLNGNSEELLKVKWRLTWKWETLGDGSHFRAPTIIEDFTPGTQQFLLLRILERFSGSANGERKRAVILKPIQNLLPNKCLASREKEFMRREFWKFFPVEGREFVLSSSSLVSSKEKKIIIIIELQ